MKRIVECIMGVLILLLTEPIAFSGTILSVNGLGKVEANTYQHELVFSSYGGPMEFSVCWNELHWIQDKGLYVGSERCVQGEVNGWAKSAFRARVRKIKMPHYRTFTVTISRYGKIGVAICRENDGKIGCVHLSQ